MIHYTSPSSFSNIKMTLSNFLLNTVASILNIATTAPNVDEIHSMLDRVSSQVPINYVLHKPSQERERDGSVTSHCEYEILALPKKEGSRTKLVPSLSNNRDTGSRRTEDTRQTSECAAVVVPFSTDGIPICTDCVRTSGEESIDDDDHHSAKSNKSTTDVPYADESFDNVESVQFPNGKKKYRIEGTDHQIGWATYQYGHNENKNKVSTS